MRKALKIAGGLLGAVVLLVAAGAAYFLLAFPKAGDPPEVAVEATPARLARGEYLFDHVTGCADCHSHRDLSLVGGPVEPGSVGAGGFPFDLAGAGTLYAKNITPAGIGDWTDGQLIHALRAGVTPDGTALFPLMPYYNFRHLSRDDLYAIVAYVRTLGPLPDSVPARTLKVPLNLIVRTMPSDPGPIPDRTPDPSNTVAYGEYLVTIASCRDCHSQNVRGKPIDSLRFAGGNEFREVPGLVVRSANITPDSATGIGSWTREGFITRFKDHARWAEAPRPLEPGENPSPMPWIFLSGMTESDLGSIYDYLRTVPPVHNAVVRFERTPPAR